MNIPIKACRICGNSKLISIVNLGEQSLTGIFPKNKTEKITSGPLEIVKCVEEKDNSTCGLVQLKHSYNNEEMYGANYGYRSGLNASMVAHLQSIVNKTVELVSLKPGDFIIDIGSSDCTLLKSYPFNEYLLVGIDPSALKFIKYYPENIRLIPDFFSSEIVKSNFPGKKAKIITSIAMFYDLESPLDFMKEIYDILDEEGVWVFEQSYMPLMLERIAYDTICHEHLEYYGLKQIKWMLDKVGFKIIDIELNDTNGGSSRLSVAKQESSKPEAENKVKDILLNEGALQLSRMQVFEKFRDRVVKHRDKLIAVIKKIKNENKTIFGYGASTKGNVILQYCNITSAEIPFIAEVNEDKFGSFTPNTLIPIISEKEAKAMNPDYFLVLPWHFRENIISREQDFLNSGGKLLFPIPAIEIVGN